MEIPRLWSGDFLSCKKPAESVRKDCGFVGRFDGRI